MDTTDDKNTPFPEGFGHIQEQLNETTTQVEQLDNQIKNIPKEKGPTLEYRPPHFIGRVIPGSRDKARIALEEKQHEIKSDMLSKTEAETRGVTGQTGRVVRDRVREQLFPNPYRTMSREDKLNQRNVAKEIEQSQDYMDAMLSPKEITPEETTQPKPDEAGKKDMTSTGMSMSARFSMSLSYTKATERSDTRTTPPRDKQPDKDKDED